MRSLLVEAVVCSRRELASTAVFGTTVTTTPIPLAVLVDPKIGCLADCHSIEDIALVEISWPVADMNGAALHAPSVDRPRLVAQKVLELVRSRTYDTKAGGLVGVGLLTPGVGEPGA